MIYKKWVLKIKKMFSSQSTLRLQMTSRGISFVFLLIGSILMNVVGKDSFVYKLPGLLWGLFISLGGIPVIVRREAPSVFPVPKLFAVLYGVLIVFLGLLIILGIFVRSG